MFPQKSEETNPVLVLNGLALSTGVISRCSQLFKSFPLGWEVVDVWLVSPLTLISECAQISSEHHRNTAGSCLDEKILVWTSWVCSLGWDLPFAYYWEISETQGVRALLHTMTLYNVKRGVKWQQQEVSWGRVCWTELYNEHRVLILAKHHV